MELENVSTNYKTTRQKLVALVCYDINLFQPVDHMRRGDGNFLYTLEVKIGKKQQGGQLKFTPDHSSFISFKN